MAEGETKMIPETDRKSGNRDNGEIVIFSENVVGDI